RVRGRAGRIAGPVERLEAELVPDPPAGIVVVDRIDAPPLIGRQFEIRPAGLVVDVDLKSSLSINRHRAGRVEVNRSFGDTCRRTPAIIEPQLPLVTSPRGRPKERDRDRPGYHSPHNV